MASELGRRYGEAAQDHLRASGESSRLLLHRHGGRDNQQTFHQLMFKKLR